MAGGGPHIYVLYTYINMNIYSMVCLGQIVVSNCLVSFNVHISHFFNYLLLDLL